LVPMSWPTEYARHLDVRTTSIYPLPKMSPDRALGVGLGASQKEISVAYRRLARVHHPDVAGDEERMKWINAAYRELRR
jgi:DnaJ-domain-containing protein 1